MKNVLIFNHFDGTYEVFIEGGYHAWTYNDLDLHTIELDFLEYEIRIFVESMWEFYEFYCTQNATLQDKIIFEPEEFSFSRMIQEIIKKFNLDCSELNFIFISDPDVDLMIHEMNFILFDYKRYLHLSLISEFVINENNPYTVTSMFSGCGGFDLGFHRARFKILWANDNDPHACISYRKNFEDVHFIRGDVKSLSDEEFPRFSHVLIGGFPCQGFSQAGLQEIDDSRNFLYIQFKRGLRIVKPLIFIAENVPGILTIGNGKVFKKILSDFEQTGYDVSYKILNARDFGAPQDRARVFIVGTRKDTRLKFRFPESPHKKFFLPYRTLKESIWHLREKFGDYYQGDKKLSFLTNGYSREFMSRQRKGNWEVGFNEYIFNGEENRTLSIKECLIIQSFPEDFKLFGTIKAKYSQIGNAVPPILSYYLANSVKNCLKSYSNTNIEN